MLQSNASKMLLAVMESHQDMDIVERILVKIGSPGTLVCVYVCGCGCGCVGVAVGGWVGACVRVCECVCVCICVGACMCVCTCVYCVNQLLRIITICNCNPGGVGQDHVHHHFV